MGRVAELRLVDGLHYRRDAFAAGLASLGFEITLRSNRTPRKGDVLVLWNRYIRDEARAAQYEVAGGTVLVTENAWLGPEEKDEHLFALCRGHHNGAGAWQVGSHDRWADMGIPISPWRSDGSHILVLPQRGMGEAGIAQPYDWESHICRRINAATDRPIAWRMHPGKRPHPIIDFTGAWAVVTWGSGAAVKAVVAGIPVFYELLNWIGAPAAKHGIANLEAPFLGDRLPMLRRLAWAQWSSSEIATGEPFRWLLAPQSMSTENSELARRFAPPLQKASIERAM